MSHFLVVCAYHTGICQQKKLNTNDNGNEEIKIKLKFFSQETTNAYNLCVGWLSELVRKDWLKKEEGKQSLWEGHFT